MKDVYASQFIEVVTLKAPLLNLDAKKLLSFDETKYTKAIQAIIEKWYVENYNQEQLLEYSQLNNDELEIAKRWIIEYVLFRYLRGEWTNDSLRINLMQDLQFPEQRVKSLITLLEKHRTTIASNFIFRNIQDVFFRQQRLENNQIQMINLMIKMKIPNSF
jgi:hypothetical protein